MILSVLRGLFLSECAAEVDGLIHNKILSMVWGKKPQFYNVYETALYSSGKTEQEECFSGALPTLHLLTLLLQPGCTRSFQRVRRAEMSVHTSLEYEAVSVRAT